MTEKRICKNCGAEEAKGTMVLDLGTCDFYCDILCYRVTKREEVKHGSR